MSNTVLKDLKDGILLLTLNRPEKKNSFNLELWTSLAAELDAARVNDDVTVVVITGAGSDFSAGQDLKDYGVSGAAHSYRITERAVVDFDKPLLAAAKGVAVGGGATILFHTDVLYVGESLRMRLPFNSLGMAPEFASSYMLQAIIGPQRAAELLFTTEWIDADKALELGIASRKFKDDELLANAMAKAAEIAQLPLSSLMETKKCLKMAHKTGIENALKVEQESMDRLAGGPASIEAMMAFMEKRKPDFRNLKKKQQ
ncbi:MAG: enoyl-CoA hydratase [Deltaproteobacteria bacterium HGW-Deltaproteobacteria-12]|jgi:enoyl-CoA hydratase/carnithine racemase|nr:MAG: enoyl-CoA hydratase [Deltaproteobacteria bacterium HGW-Deltaproteobacteria-12]